MRVVVSEAAYADLLDIGRAIARDNPARAISFVDKLHERCMKVIDDGAGVSALARVGKSRRPTPTVRRLFDFLPDLGARSAGATGLAWRTGLRASSVP
jgi:plasmid stabilization system protein ParE